MSALGTNDGCLCPGEKDESMYFPVPDEGRLDASISGADLNDPGHRPHAFGNLASTVVSTALAGKYHLVSIFLASLGLCCFGAGDRASSILKCTTPSGRAAQVR